MQRLNNFTMYASKVIEIIFFVLLGLLAVSVIVSSIAIGWANGKIKENNIDIITEIEKYTESSTEIDFGNTLSLGGEALKAEKILRSDGTINTALIVMLFLYGMFNCAAFGMIFRNIYLIIKTAKGKTWFSAGETPFQADITRMIREIGIFLIGLAVIEIIMSLFTSLIDVNLIYVVIGILMLCLSSFFSYGEQLQRDSDGLI